MADPTPNQNHYKTLALPSAPSEQKTSKPQEIRLAYRRALLLHHPDKTKPTPIPSKYTIDEITTAYKTLIDPTSRSEYDRLLSLRRSDTTSQHAHAGLETVDLDDLSCDEREGIWYRGCRCGRAGGYVVTEEELELNAEYGETITGCQGCSLWLRVTFAVAEEG